jgi:MraZ protein
VDPPSTASEAKTSPMPPVAAGPKEREEKAQPGEPPLAPAPGPVQMYEVHGKAETLADIARKTLGSSTRLSDIHRLNPNLKPDTAVDPGTVVKLPGDACIPADEIEAVRPLPALRPKPPVKARVVLPLTGTYPVNLDDQKRMTLPKALRDQLAGADMVLVSPGTDQCLWMTNQAHLDRLAQKLERSPAQEADVRVFKRLYFAQTEKAPLGSDGRVAIPERLAQFAGLHQEVVLVGIDDHFEVWDAARWRQYTQQKSAAARSAAPADHDHE